MCTGDCWEDAAHPFLQQEGGLIRCHERWRQDHEWPHRQCHLRVVICILSKDGGVVNVRNEALSETSAGMSRAK